MFLLKNRFGWMNDYLEPSARGLEVGSGSGLSREFITRASFLQTDYTEADWLDVKNVDALRTPFENAQFDFVISSHVIHHVPSPMKFFREMERILKPGGLLLINEVKNSLLMRTILRLMKHESYDYNVSVFEEAASMKKQTADLWAANCAVPDLLFHDPQEFCRRVPAFAVIRDEFCECTVLLNSGGVDRATLHVSLPSLFLKMLSALDRLLISLSPDMFAMSRRLVLQKSGAA
jgi:SAM-dependent methyltransferase